jgi:hypothetical protein
VAGFSVFTAAGLIPASILGLDIHRLLQGAADMTRQFLEQTVQQQYPSAICRYQLPLFCPSPEAHSHFVRLGKKTGSPRTVVRPAGVRKPGQERDRPDPPLRQCRPATYTLAVSNTRKAVATVSFTTSSSSKPQQLPLRLGHLHDNADGLETTGREKLPRPYPCCLAGKLTALMPMTLAPRLISFYPAWTSTGWASSCKC